ncbi:MAG: hypothetical protein M1825_003307 [Sarcosagium campestre]|nr:MAG: hypothetical protein M1825_003307 [Sarcosagium campestre]
MIVTSFGNTRKHPESSRPPLPSHAHSDFGHGAAGVPLPAPTLSSVTTSGVQNPNVIYHHIHDLSAKRISTLDYLKKAHEGRVYWFNTLLFNKQDLSKMPFFDPKKLSRRATNYLLLGLSLPTLIDHNPQNPLEYLRNFYALLAEFDTYQQVHPPDGSSASSLSRARIPSMFKRAAHTSGSKGRRGSSATEIGLPMSSSSDPSDLKTMTGGIPSNVSSGASAFPSNEQELLPGEEYSHLLTPSLPFEPDFYETFATLCDVLIDCYTRVVGLISSPALCNPSVGEMFTKTDAKVRKIIVGGVVKDFEDTSRAGVKSEVAGVGRVVLGGLL